MRQYLSLPARINILGNPSDANEGDFATISAAVEIRAGAIVEPADHFIIEYLENRPSPANPAPAVSAHQEFALDALPLPYDGVMPLIKGALNRLYQFSEPFRAALQQRGGIHIAIGSNVPRQSGLGGSSLFIALTLAALREFYNLDQYLHNDYILCELTQRVEANELGITCGYADRYVPLMGGLAYIDYRAKLRQRPLRQEPYATYERLDHWISDIPLLAICTGIPHDSGDVHGRMRPRYLDEYTAWEQSGGNPPPMVQFMSAAWETAWRGKIALLEQDWPTFGALMNDNHHAVDKMMRYCGFEDGAGWANNLFIEIALQNGALGAKLTGAGGGGSVFALVQPGDEERLAITWQHAADERGLTEAWVYRPRIARQGLVQQHD